MGRTRRRLLKVEAVAVEEAAVVAAAVADKVVVQPRVPRKDRVAREAAVAVVAEEVREAVAVEAAPTVSLQLHRLLRPEDPTVVHC